MNSIILCVQHMHGKLMYVPYMDSSEMCFELDEQYFMKAFALPVSSIHQYFASKQF
jgi:hypothetical protein